jgi:hypothetical protein
MNESDQHINFNSLKNSMTSLLAAIGALDSPLGPHPESDLQIDLYSSSLLGPHPESDRQMALP